MLKNVSIFFLRNNLGILVDHNWSEDCTALIFITFKLHSGS
jgi:hypothetical protein